MPHEFCKALFLKKDVSIIYLHENFFTEVHELRNSSWQFSIVPKALGASTNFLHMALLLLQRVTNFG